MDLPFLLDKYMYFQAKDSISMQSKSTALSCEQLIRPLLNIVPTLLKSSIIDTTIAIRLTEVKLFVPFLKKIFLLVVNNLEQCH